MQFVRFRQIFDARGGEATEAIRQCTNLWNDSLLRFLFYRHM